MIGAGSESRSSPSTPALAIASLKTPAHSAMGLVCAVRVKACDEMAGSAGTGTGGLDG